MSEIKFRAWIGENMIYRFDISSSGEIFMEVQYQGRIYYKDYKLIQYIVLKDKNGKEIYEGDIAIFTDNQDLTKLVLIDYMTLFLIYYGYYHLECGYYEENYEVIGNIYQTPELLNGDKK